MGTVDIQNLKNLLAVTAESLNSSDYIHINKLPSVPIQLANSCGKCSEKLKLIQ